jgi:AbrB family looped-hinge helix DNA binding protein
VDIIKLSNHRPEILELSPIHPMSETVTIDRKGRLVLPKRVRERAGIRPRTKLLAEVRGPGIVELRDSTALLEKVREVAAKKLTGWKEAEHEEDRTLMKLAK